MTPIIAGYPAAPAGKEEAFTYYRRLAGVERAGGLGLAWEGSHTASDIALLLEIVPQHWVFTLNALPGTNQAWARDHRFGLASPEEIGRQAAIDMAAEIAAAIKAINAKAGRSVVMAVEMQSAPGFGERVIVPDAHAFHRSLEQISKFDWDGAAVLIEHCDTFIPGRTPAKGFLTLAQEIEALQALPGSPIGLSLNWGRSVIELRDPARVVEHVRQARRSGLLRGFTLSGTGAQDNACGVAWADSHLPFADTLNSKYAEPTSLMTVARADETLRELPELLFLAVKTSWPASRPDPEERAASVIANLETAVELLDRHAPFTSR